MCHKPVSLINPFTLRLKQLIKLRELNLLMNFKKNVVSFLRLAIN